MLLKRLINHYKKLNNYYNDLIIIKKYLLYLFNYFIINLFFIF